MPWHPIDIKIIPKKNIDIKGYRNMFDTTYVAQAEQKKHVESFYNNHEENKRQLNMAFVQFKYILPHWLQDLIATIDFVISLFLLQVSLSDEPHLPTSYEVLISLILLMPITVNPIM
jgi:hypothetical protein